MNSSPLKAQSSISLIESQPDGSFLYYPNGKLEFPEKSGQIYGNAFRSNNKTDLERMAWIYKWTTRLLSFLPIFLMTFAQNNLSINLIAACLAFLLLDCIMLMPSALQARLLTIFFPNIQHVTKDSNKSLRSDMLPQEKQKASSVVRVLFPSLLIGLIYFVWSMLTKHQGSPYWRIFFAASPFLVLMTASLGPLALLVWLPPKHNSMNYSKIFFPLYIILAVIWLGILNGIPTPKTSIPDLKSYKMTARTGVDWRTEISQVQESNSWPFKEASYMLGCQGINGNYLVYLVKTDDIKFKFDRPENFVPQYYGLKGSLPGWEKGESQLLSGQPTQVLQKYVEQSLTLCKRAEAAKDNQSAVPLNKK